MLTFKNVDGAFIFIIIKKKKKFDYSRFINDHIGSWEDVCCTYHIVTSMPCKYPKNITEQVIFCCATS